VRSRLLRSGAENLATPRQPVRPEVVTHVLGTFRYPCLRAGQGLFGTAGWTRTPDLLIHISCSLPRLRHPRRLGPNSIEPEPRPDPSLFSRRAHQSDGVAMANKLGELRVVAKPQRKHVAVATDDDGFPPSVFQSLFGDDEVTRR